jgi:hypothetical protein
MVRNGDKVGTGKFNSPKRQVGSLGTNRSFNQLAGRIHSFLRRHPEISQEEFLLDAVQNELGLLEQKEVRRVTSPHVSQRAPVVRKISPALDEQFVDRVATITERLAKLHDQRYGVWPQMRRFLFG